MGMAKKKKLPTPTPGQVIKQVRQERGLSQRPFAAELGVTYNAIHLWETNQSDFAMDTLRSWWNDDRQWVQNMAVAVMAARFPGLIRANGDGPT